MTRRCRVATPSPWQQRLCSSRTAQTPNCPTRLAIRPFRSPNATTTPRRSGCCGGICRDIAPGGVSQGTGRSVESDRVRSDRHRRVDAQLVGSAGIDERDIHSLAARAQPAADDMSVEADREQPARSSPPGGGPGRAPEPEPAPLCARRRPPGMWQRSAPVTEPARTRTRCERSSRGCSARCRGKPMRAASSLSGSHTDTEQAVARPPSVLSAASSCTCVAVRNRSGCIGAGMSSAGCGQF